jgi:nucleotide-binding universal stress UspA family protein
MYDRILLAYDGSLEGRTALREGALLAKACGAHIFLLSVVAETAGLQIGESAFAGAVVHERNAYKAVFDEGVERLKHLGFDPVAKLVEGEPALEISAFAKQVSAELVVVGHRRQNIIKRWWSGSTGAYLLDNIGCSLLVARHMLSDDEFEKIWAAQLAGAPD